MQRGEVPVADPVVAANPLPKTSLHRALEAGQLGWFAAVPARLAVFLRVAGCPPEQVGAWLARLAELGLEPEQSAAPVPGPPGTGPPGTGPPGSGPPGSGPPGADRSGTGGDGNDRGRTDRGGRRGGRRWVWLAAGIPVVAGMVFLIVLAGYAEFYGAFGAGMAQAPVSPATLAVSTFFATLVMAAVALLVVGAAATGAALVPWGGRSRATVPAFALTVMLATTAWASLGLLVPRDYRQIAVALALMVALGLLSRLINTQRHAHLLAGAAIGFPGAGGLVLLAWSVGRWSGSIGWLVVAQLVGATAVAVPLGWWIRRDLRRDGLSRPGPIRPATLLAQLRDDIAPSIPAIMRSTLPSRDARRLAAGFGVMLAALPVAAVLLVMYLVASAGTAGEAAREYGYVPPGAGSPLIWSDPVAPATVALREPGTDPLGVCDRAAPWAASMIGRDQGGSWVLLRPVGAGGRSPQVVWLDAGDYTVRPVLEPGVRDGTPWTRPACG